MLDPYHFPSPQTKDSSSLSVESPIDYECLVQEVVCHLRGDLSQRQLSERLGFSFNQVGKWEGGVTKIKWEDFLHLAEVLNLPIENSFRNFFWIFEGEFNVVNTVRSLEKTLALSSNTQFAERGLVRKWIKGSSSPDFADILRALDIRPAMLIGWLATFLDCRKIHSLEKRYKTFLVCLESVLDDPNCVYVNAALHLRAYRDLKKHDEKLLAEHSACTVKQLRKTLEKLKSLNIITFDGLKYLPCPFDFSFSGLPSAKLRGLTKYTSILAANRYPETSIMIDLSKTPNSSISSVRVVAMSSVAAKKVSELITTFHNEIGEVVKDDKLPKDNVQILLLHSFASNINTPPDID